MTPEELISRILHRDGSVLVLDKPAGLPVHRGPKGGETLTDHLDDLRFGLPRRPELAHRLDRDTSGCLVLGRHPRAVRTLNELFRKGLVEKTYWALVEGGPATDEGLIDRPLAPRSPDRGWWVREDPAGLPSQTLWRVLHRSPAGCWLALKPLTGRTHQLRAHCAAEGFPIVGDAVYGRAARGARLMLHARAVEVPFDARKPPLRATAPAPTDMIALVTRWFGEEAAMLQSTGQDIVKA